jgi:type III secretion protein C
MNEKTRATSLTLCHAVMFAGRLLLAITLSASASAAEIPFARGSISYTPQEVPLRQFLAEFFADQGLTAQLSPPIATDTATVNDPLSGAPAQVFQRLAQRYQLIPYYDGSMVYVYRANERITRFLSVPANRTSTFARTLAALRLNDRYNTFTARADTGLIEVSGVPRYVQQMENLTATIQAQGLAAPAVLRSFPLRFATAADIFVTVGGRNLEIPGVASILQDLVLGPQDIGAAPADTVRQRARRAERLTGPGYSDTDLPPLTTPSRADITSTEEDPIVLPVRATRSIEGIDTRIVADAGRNAVIVRCPPDSLPIFEELIRGLDVEPRVVEIEAAIIDVDRDRLRDIGVNWRYRNNGGRGSIGFDPSLAPSTNGLSRFDACEGIDDLLCALLGNSTDLLPQRVPGAQIGAIIGDGARFISRINLLAERGLTNVVSRPQVVTLNGVEALIESAREFYVPVAGSYTVDLFNVTAGTSLRVTPHVIVGDLRQRVRLAVNIEDGNVILTPAAVAGPERLTAATIPEVVRTGVSTQAIIDEGQSLLLGGLVREEAALRESKVPGLGDLPVVGRAFKREQRERLRSERLFLITPRLVALSTITGQSVPSRHQYDVDDFGDPEAGRGERARSAVPERGGESESAAAVSDLGASAGLPH